MIKKLSLLGLIFLISACNSNKKTEQKKQISTFKPYLTKEIEVKINRLMSKMTPNEKIAQITGIRPRYLMEGDKLSLEKCRQLIPNGIGHISQFACQLTLKPNDLRDFVRDLQHFLMTETPSKIPAIFHEEAITGFATKGATTLPQQLGVACSWNPELVSQLTQTTATNMRAAGATLALSPMLDMARTPHWSRIEESYGEDSYLTSKMGLAFIKGLQGNDPKTGIATTAKHFAGYGVKNQNDKLFYEELLMAQEVAIKLGDVKSIMNSYGKHKGIAVAKDKTMLTGLLRGTLGFDGMVVSDYGSINLIYKGHKQAESPLHAGALALRAGVDTELSDGKCYPMLPEALEKNLITQSEIDTAVKRSLTMKARLGLLDENPVIGKDGDLDFDPPQFRELAYKAATQSIVLLKNNGILPLKEQPKKVALVGPNAATYHCLLGDYTYQSMISFWRSIPFDPNYPKLVTLQEGLQNKMNPSVQIKHERGCDWSAPLEATINPTLGDDRLSKVKLMTFKNLPQPNLDNALKIAQESDIIIAAMGENYYLSGEGRERKGISLPGEQKAFVEKMIATGKPVILVVFGGRPQIITELEKKCAAVLQAWFPGEEGGNAVADIILGNINPTAKLCMTYPSNESKKERCYNTGYHDKNNQPLYPFGYGLSYSSYTYSDLKIATTAHINDERIPISFKVKNTSNVNGAEIAQLYVSPIDKNSTMKPIQLKGFERINLKASEEKEITFKISPQQLAQYKSNKWVIKPGKYEFKAAASCVDIRLKATIDIQGDPIFLEKGRSVFFATR